ncbi:MAG: diaminopimelate epimerase [Gemmataceae bacterium]|nr:diaminopimelate epimerase [Gemmataceae bacterium]MCS7272008.1 diaminopimelate epimerase [Gemmataceae bacterium]MDW8241915.1 diaminopimelate epimerase [Thermogemmata sp.]
MRFVKLHGLGNDYVYVDCLHGRLPREPEELSRRISDRHFGVGADGLILICPSERADVRMRIFNADGSEAEMCGNGIRGLAKYVYDHGLVRKNPLHVETGRGVLVVEMEVGADGKVHRATVNMGPPILRSVDIPTTLPGDPPRDVAWTVAGQTFRVTAVSMGNPHAVIYVDGDFLGTAEGTDRVAEWGPRLERAPEFPRRVNVHFVQVHSPREVTMRTWERGSGLTLACGTGACAVCVAGVLTGRTDRHLQAHLPGGNLELHWSAADNCVYMTGPAVEVFQGEWPD